MSVLCLAYLSAGGVNSVAVCQLVCSGTRSSLVQVSLAAFAQNTL